MKRKVKKTLNKLYTIDGGLREYEKEIKFILDKFVDKYPFTKFDDDFLKTFRREFIEKEYDFEKIARRFNEANKKPINNFKIIQFSYYILASIMLAIILITAITYYFF